MHRAKRLRIVYTIGYRYQTPCRQCPHVVIVVVLVSVSDPWGYAVRGTHA